MAPSRKLCAKNGGRRRSPGTETIGGASYNNWARLGQNIFQVHGVDAAGGIVVRKRLRRGQVLIFFNGLPHCLFGMEACATAHHCDAADAEAICEAVRRPTMRFVPVKTVEQQSALLMHRARDLLIRQRTIMINALRGHPKTRRLLEHCEVRV